LPWRSLSAVDCQPILNKEMGHFQKCIRSATDGSITSFQAIGVFAHWILPSFWVAIFQHLRPIPPSAPGFHVQNSGSWYCWRRTFSHCQKCPSTIVKERGPAWYHSDSWKGWIFRRLQIYSLAGTTNPKISISIISCCWSFTGLQAIKCFMTH
jgi:hypothetical protein